LWLGCAASFRAGRDPRLDAQRLALVCGPQTGMRRAAEPIEGPATEQGDRHPFAVRADTCYRIFAVADPGVTDLDVAVLSVRGSRLAQDDSADRVVMVDAARPFCSFADDELTIEVRANRGLGRYAMHIYQLPANR
jgi:hypothetical protein